MEFFRFVPPTLVALSTCFVLVAAIPMPQEAAPDTPADVTRLEAAPAPAPVSFSRALPSQPASAPAAPRASNPQTNSRFLPPGLFQAPSTNPNQGLQNTLAAGGLGAVGAVAAGGCLFGGNCDLSFRPSLGAAVDANGQIVPQLGLTTQVGSGQGVGTTFTGGVQPTVLGQAAPNLNLFNLFNQNRGQPQLFGR